MNFTFGTWLLFLPSDINQNIQTLRFAWQLFISCFGVYAPYSDTVANSSVNNQHHTIYNAKNNFFNKQCTFSSAQNKSYNMPKSCKKYESANTLHCTT